uniref:7TM GPCR serpentine receptor class x (Srx) domain-containing protein n=1 Tax=Ditylenchus dipsaci TaxID=166011 RepID=A0A915ES36_9BILA
MIFLQVLIISIAHAISAGFYMYENYYPVSQGVIFFVTYCWICTHGMPCIIYLSLNKTIRKECWHMFRNRFQHSGSYQSRITPHESTLTGKLTVVRPSLKI